MTKKIKETSEVYGGIKVSEIVDRWGEQAWVNAFEDIILITWERDETPEEKAARERKAERAKLAAAARKQKADEKDRALYEQLKARFENDDA